PTPPTSSLPALARLAAHTVSQITDALDNLSKLYFPPPSPPAPRLRTLIHDGAVPDSGYASEEEDDDLAPPEPQQADDEDIDVLRADTFERSFAIKWLTGFTARADTFLTSGAPSEADARADAVDTAAALLSAFVDSPPEQAVTRAFSFASPSGPVHIELNDAPLLAGDHTSVGLQSWASSIVLAERMCATPSAFSLATGARIIELGAGTGLLSIAAAKLFPASEVIATDYHPDVLANLERNVTGNGVDVAVRALDWEHPEFPEGGAFDVVLAADVVYHPAHAAWIRACVEGLLAKDGAFWMIVALRATGRHEGLADTVGEVFPRLEDARDGGEILCVLREETLGRMDGCGRADEGGYRLYRIGWA
ncbi:S-adenosyl-L-methionine-dependent methyltransferase, partial [Artomyces pyxidatus]